MKRPAFQFYPGDWRKDPALSSCSLAARGLWIELMCIAHESDNYGHLSINGKPMTPAMISRMVGEVPAVVMKLLVELHDAGVYSRTDDGTIYSRRMVKDEHVRNVRADAGRLGGNPNLLKQTDKQTDNQEVKQSVKQVPTPSSSSSSSSSEGLGARRRRTQVPADFRPDQTGIDKANAVGLDVDTEVEKFRDYHAGKGSTMLDWQAAWRTWVGNAVSFGKAKPAAAAFSERFI